MIAMTVLACIAIEKWGEKMKKALFDAAYFFGVVHILGLFMCSLILVLKLEEPMVITPILIYCLVGTVFFDIICIFGEEFE